MSIRRFNQILRVTTLVAVAAALAAPTVQARVVRGSGSGLNERPAATPLSPGVRSQSSSVAPDRNHPYSVTPERTHPYGVTATAPQASSGGSVDWAPAGALAGMIILLLLAATYIQIRRRGPVTT